MRYHAVIVGAGSAGCVLTTRLSDDPGRSVLLLEAGPDYATEADLPPEIRSALTPAYTHDWEYVNQPDSLGRSIELPLCCVSKAKRRKLGAQPPNFLPPQGLSDEDMC